MPAPSSRLLCSFNSEGFQADVYQHESGEIVFQADGDIDADGSPHAYHPKSSKGLDALANAGRPGNWWGIATDRNGKPFVQGPDDPAPGFYISTTAYEFATLAKNNPHRYLDSETIPFIVVEGFIRRRAKGVVLGAAAQVTNLDNGKSVKAIVGDLGPLYKIGEISIAAARAIGIDGDPRKGGTDKPILKYQIWPGRTAEINGVSYPLIPMKSA